jgi:hypothetical protein
MIVLYKKKGSNRKLLYKKENKAQAEPKTEQRSHGKDINISSNKLQLLWNKEMCLKKRMKYSIFFLGGGGGVTI